MKCSWEFDGLALPHQAKVSVTPFYVESNIIEINRIIINLEFAQAKIEYKAVERFQSLPV